MSNAGNVFVINCGSSSIKFQIIEPISTKVWLSGIIERLGQPGSKIKFKCPNDNGKLQKEEKKLEYENNVNNNSITELYLFALNEISKLAEDR